VYDNNPSILTPGVTVLPPGCTTGCVVATNDGSYPGVWDNALGLDLGAPYPVRGYPTGINPATGLPSAAATDGLRNITGRVNPGGTVTIWAVTSTVSGDGDQGADPNKLVAVTDKLAAVAPPAESFRTIQAAGFGEVLRGVSFTPGTEITSR
jgi:hypothetical protein